MNSQYAGLRQLHARGYVPVNVVSSSLKNISLVVVPSLIVTTIILTFLFRKKPEISEYEDEDGRPITADKLDDYDLRD